MSSACPHITISGDNCRASDSMGCKNRAKTAGIAKTQSIFYGDGFHARNAHESRALRGTVDAWPESTAVCYPVVVSLVGDSRFWLGACDHSKCERAYSL